MVCFASIGHLIRSWKKFWTGAECAWKKHSAIQAVLFISNTLHFAWHRTEKNCYGKFLGRKKYGKKRYCRAGIFSRICFSPYSNLHFHDFFLAFFLHFRTFRFYPPAVSQHFRNIVWTATKLCIYSALHCRQVLPLSLSQWPYPFFHGRRSCCFYGAVESLKVCQTRKALSDLWMTHINKQNHFFEFIGSKKKRRRLRRQRMSRKMKENTSSFLRPSPQQTFQLPSSLGDFNTLFFIFFSFECVQSTGLRPCWACTGQWWKHRRADVSKRRPSNKPVISSGAQET